MRYLKGQETIGKDSNGNEVSICHFICDEYSDIPSKTEYQTSAKVILAIGSTALVISPRSSYKMKSDGTWVIQDVGNDYYSKAETDDLLDDKADKSTTYTITETNTLLSDRMPLKNADYTPLTTAGTWDLFTLPVGVYYRTSNVSAVSHIPSDLTSAFFCIVQNTIGSNRRQIILYPCVAATTGTFYRCLETGSGYGSWYKFAGTEVT